MCAIVGCKQAHDGYTISGDVRESWDGKKVYLYLKDVEPSRLIDSTVISKGKFEIKGNFETPRFCELRLYLNPNDKNNRNFIVSSSFFVDSTEVNVRCDKFDKRPSFSVIGSSISDQYAEYIKENEQLYDKEVFQKYSDAYYKENDLDLAYKYAKEVALFRKKKHDHRVQFINNHPESPVSLKIVQDMITRAGNVSRKETLELFNTLSVKLRNSEAGVFTKSLLEARKVYVGELFRDAIVDDIALNQCNLKDYIKDGTHTLIEFWASWCGPCRGDIPSVKRAYEKYHPRGFNIVSVSIDKNIKSWQKAVREEDMSWVQLRNRKGDNSIVETYGVTYVPSTFLVDKKGIITHVDLRGGWLDMELNRIYNN
ncbi:Thiol-disulfide isomerase or thioredoxin [Saccharicrinis carchari]|uniref:Thiol-disulfide isomerase or thioredoxin n=2 Tax=Saccharicrinis carchari TaxID=1168039 RepID=A0A521B4Z2_SACCC|nr:Thiol-disulfide isomerase or thioredoxin [Saccharicrinis carchari]